MKPLVLTLSTLSVSTSTKITSSLSLDSFKISPSGPITIDRPTSFHISALSTESKQKFLDNTFNYKGYNEEFVKFVRKHTEAHLEQDQLMAKDCVNYLETFDQARGTDWRKVLPVDNLV